MNALRDCLQTEDVLLDLQVKTQRELFDAIGHHVERIGGLSAEAVSGGLMRREQAASTALGLGVAVPHARVKGLARMRVLYARLLDGFAFNAPDEHAVRDIMVLLVPDPASQQHLDMLALVVSLFSDASFRSALHECREPEKIKSLVDAWSLAAVAPPAAGSTVRAFDNQA